MTAFQTQVYGSQAPAVEGDFASANPRASVLAGEGGLVAGRGVDAGVAVAGAIMGRFGWASYAGTDNDEAPAVLNTFGIGQPIGLVHREQIGYILLYLQEASMVLPTGNAITAFNDGDLWIRNRGSTYAMPNMKTFANFADGTAYFAAPGSTPPGGSGTTSSIAAGAFGATGSVADNILTVTGGVTGANGIVAGGTIAGTGVATGTKILGQVTPLLAGEALGGIGRYYVSIPEQSAASTAITGTYGILTVAGTVTGAFAINQPITGTNVVAGTTIYSQLTGTAGGAGTYVVDNNTVVASTAITSQSAVETKWYCKSGGAPGELVKISNII
jgi:hypothetical protein